MTKKILWVDDIRNPSDKLLQSDAIVDIARSYDEAIDLLESTDYDTIYLDHDLGDVGWVRERTGYDVVVWIADRNFSGKHVPTEYIMLTSNPVGRARMQGVVDRYLSIQS